LKLPRLIIRALGAVFFAALALTSLTVTASYARAFESGLVFYPRALHYSGIPLGDTRTLAVVITNYSKDLVTISDITSTSSQFSVSRVILPRVLEPGRGFDLKVSFTPTAEGVADGQITVLSNAPDQTLSLGVSGTGTGGRVTASPERVWFGDVKLGATSTVSLLLTNPSAWKVTIHGVRVSGGAFSLSGPSFPLTLAPTAVF
jgi:hypothetical protein